MLMLVSPKNNNLLKYENLLLRVYKQRGQKVKGRLLYLSRILLRTLLFIFELLIKSFIVYVIFRYLYLVVQGTTMFSTDVNESVGPHYKVMLYEVYDLFALQDKNQKEPKIDWFFPFKSTFYNHFIFLGKLSMLLTEHTGTNMIAIGFKNKPLNQFFPCAASEFNPTIPLNVEVNVRTANMFSFNPIKETYKLGEGFQQRLNKLTDSFEYERLNIVGVQNYTRESFLSLFCYAVLITLSFYLISFIFATTLFIKQYNKIIKYTRSIVNMLTIVPAYILLPLMNLLYIAFPQYIGMKTLLLILFLPRVIDETMNKIQSIYNRDEIQFFIYNKMSKVKLFRDIMIPDFIRDIIKNFTPRCFIIFNMMIIMSRNFISEHRANNYANDFFLAQKQFSEVLFFATFYSLFYGLTSMLIKLVSSCLVKDLETESEIKEYTVLKFIDKHFFNKRLSKEYEKLEKRKTSTPNFYMEL